MVASAAPIRLPVRSQPVQLASPAKHGASEARARTGRSSSPATDADVAAHEALLPDEDDDCASLHFPGRLASHGGSCDGAGLERVPAHRAYTDSQVPELTPLRCGSDMPLEEAGVAGKWPRRRRHVRRHSQGAQVVDCQPWSQRQLTGASDLAALSPTNGLAGAGFTSATWWCHRQVTSPDVASTGEPARRPPRSSWSTSGSTSPRPACAGMRQAIVRGGAAAKLPPLPRAHDVSSPLPAPRAEAVRLASHQVPPNLAWPVQVQAKPVLEGGGGPVRLSAMAPYPSFLLPHQDPQPPRAGTADRAPVGMFSPGQTVTPAQSSGMPASKSHVSDQ